MTSLGLRLLDGTQGQRSSPDPCPSAPLAHLWPRKRDLVLTPSPPPPPTRMQSPFPRRSYQPVSFRNETAMSRTLRALELPTPCRTHLRSGFLSLPFRALRFLPQSSAAVHPWGSSLTHPAHRPVPARLRINNTLIWLEKVYVFLAAGSGTGFRRRHTAAPACSTISTMMILYPTPRRQRSMMASPATMNFHRRLPSPPAAHLVGQSPIACVAVCLGGESRLGPIPLFHLQNRL